MKRVRSLIAGVAALGLALGLGACSNFTNSITSFSANYQTSVAAINADIAATAPDIAIACSNLQTAAMLVAPFVPTSVKAQGSFAAANAAIGAYCQNIPTNIATTLTQVQVAALAAQKAYNAVKAGAA